MPKKAKAAKKNRNRDQLATSNLSAPMASLFQRAVVPARLFTNLKFGQGYALTGSSGLAGRTFSLNCPFDPDVTGTGNQPVFFDQLAAIYNKYRVVRAHWQVKVVSKTATNAGVVAAAPTPGVADTSFASVEELGEEPGGAFKEFGSAGSPPATLRGSVDMNDVYGNTKLALEVLDGYASVSNTRPSNEVYLAICVNTSGTTDTTQLMVEIVYECWWERRVMNDLSAKRRKEILASAGAQTQTAGCVSSVAPCEQQALPILASASLVREKSAGSCAACGGH